MLVFSSGHFNYYWLGPYTSWAGGPYTEIGIENYWLRKSLLVRILISKRAETIYSVSTVESSLTHLPDAGYCRSQMGHGVHDHLGIPRIPAPAEIWGT